MELFQKIQLLAELIRCGDEVYTWCYQADGKLLYSNCPEKDFLDEAFELFGCKQKMLARLCPKSQQTGNIGHGYGHGVGCCI